MDYSIPSGYSFQCKSSPEADFAASIISFLVDEAFEIISGWIISSREEIVYAGSVLAGVALVAVIVGKVATALFFSMCANCLLGLSAWAFRTRDEKNSRDLGLENGKLLKSLEEANQNLGVLKISLAELQQKNQGNEQVIQKLSEQIEELEKTKMKLTEEMALLNENNRKLEGHLQDLLQIENDLTLMALNRMNP
ncbi:MAG: hypothetical protein Q8L98_04660 [Chlamydiales bacterium]|nr:hypothetical protein [Chlamydiales bacterium]